LLLLVPEIAVFVFLAFKLSYAPFAAYAVLFAAVTVSAFTEIAGHLLMAREQWRDEAQSTFASAVLVATASVVLMLLGGGVILASVSVLVGNVIGLVLMARHARKDDEGSHATLHLRLILPWAVFVLIEQASYHFEILWLDEMQSHEAVAHFSAVYRILGLSGPLVLVAKQLLLPSATRLTSPEEVARFARAGALVGAGAGVVASVACVLLFPFVLPVLYPFANAETNAVGSRLSWIMVFWFVQTGLVQAALGQGKLRALIVWASAQLALQVVLNLWLGKEGGAAGAATAKVLAAALTLVLIAGPLRIARPNGAAK
jgi:O-antigen/teichoic acid export membrane protein